MKKKIILLGAAEVAGEWKYPSAGNLSVESAEGTRLIRAGLAREVDAPAKAPRKKVLAKKPVARKVAAPPAQVQEQPVPASETD